MAGTGSDTVALTGGTGFIGGRLLGTLLAESLGEPRLLLRSPELAPPRTVAVAGGLCEPESLARLCADAHTVFHCAGYAHAMDDGSTSFAELHRRVNFAGTRDLAEAAGRAGVRRFVHLSSVKAMAEPGDRCVDEDWQGEPSSPYGKAKRDAELAVLEAGARYGMQVTNMRLAMVYGPGSKRGNLDRMARLIRKGWFPPLPETHNHRSLVYVDDVVAALRHVAADPRADGRTYIVAEDQAYSGRRIYDLLAQALGIAPRRWSIPRGMLIAAGLGGDFLGRVTGRQPPLNSAAVARLLESAWYSPRRIERELGWRASVALPVGLARTYAPASS